ncbi:MAG: hypothetical protein C0505_06815 [Leptothrix sp. (in: Bacteria)]|nr:hypothetical protein [Leptothrix sp. (in: b-proteobacteria)]
MAEPGSRTEVLRVGAPLDFGGVRLLLVEHTVAQAAGAGRGLWCWCSKAPYAVLVRHGGHVQAVGADAAPLPLDGLCAQVPGLAGALASL